MALVPSRLSNGEHRNPATGEAIKIKASKRVRFRAGSTLKRGI